MRDKVPSSYRGARADQLNLTPHYPVMSDRYPKLSKSAKLGEQGVLNVERLINEEFGWLFRRVHQEHDFGINGHIDIVLPDGSVTGMQM